MFEHTYGYRYKSDGHVFPIGDYSTALNVVYERRHQQVIRQTPATVELVESTPTGWQSVPLPDTTEETSRA